MEFLKEFLKNPRTVGAIAPSGKYLAKKMVEPISFDRAECIVEFGPGTGAFTAELVKKKRKDTTLILIERNQRFYSQLKEKYRDQKNVYVFHDSAENVKKYLNQYQFDTADYIVSGLPFTSLPQTVTKNIFESTREAIGRNGLFITFQYSMAKKKLFEQYFRVSTCLFELRNILPAYVLVMKNERTF